MLHLHSPDSGAEGVTPGNSAATAPLPELVSKNGVCAGRGVRACVNAGSG